MSIDSIAKKFQVSTATVSNALAGRGRMRSDLREKILAYAQEVGFYPNANAARLRSGKTGQILFSAAVEPGNSFAFNHAILTHYLTNELIRHGYDLIIHPYTHTPQSGNSIIQKALDHSVDGIILQLDATSHEKLLQKLSRAPVPIINYDASNDAQETAQVPTLTHSFVDSLLVLFSQKHFQTKSKIIILALNAVKDDRLLQDFIRVATINHMEEKVVTMTIDSCGINARKIWQDILQVAADGEVVVFFRIDPFFDSVYHVFQMLPPEIRRKIILISSVLKFELGLRNYHDVVFIPYDFEKIAVSLSNWLLAAGKEERKEKSVFIQYEELIESSAEQTSI